MSKRRPGNRRMVEVLESRVLLSATEVIRNGGFEGEVSNSDWLRTGAFQADSRFATVHQGSGYAYFATATGTAGNSLTGSMYQQVSIPSTASSLTFSFWTRITTSEAAGAAANDVMTVKVMDATGTTTLQTLATLSNQNASASYVQRTVALSRSLIGQNVRIVFEASTDASAPTTFRVDTVGLNAVSPDHTNRVVGYLPYYRQSSFSKVDLGALTHINYFSVTATTAGGLTTTNVSASNLNTVVAAAHAAGVTVSITIGPQSFSTLAASATARQAFAANIVNYALQYNLDGIDIDWEPPAGNGVANYTLLINDLYAAANPHKLLITAAVNPWTNEIAASTVNSKMDWLNVMCYDFRYNDNANWTDSISGLTDWTNWGVQRNKIVMGVPFYGRAGTSWSDTVSKTYSSFVNEYAAIHGTLPGPDVNSFVAADGKTYYMNGVTLMGQKAAYVRDNGYGGMMIWELGQDYWNASGQYNEYSLLPVLKSIMMPPAFVTASSGSRFNLVAGTLHVQAGTVTLSSDAALTHPNLNVKVANAATLVIGATQRLGALTIENGGTVRITAGGTRTLSATSLAIGSTGKLDLTNNRLVINYTGTSPAAGIVARLLSGRNGGAWNGNGIVSSTAAADANKRTAVAWGEAGELGLTTFGGVPVDATSLVLRYTYYGDTDLSGKVDADDLTRTSRGFARNVATWLGGDFDYNAALTSADQTLLYGAFGANLPSISEPDAVAVEVTEPSPLVVAEPTVTETAPAIAVPAVEPGPVTVATEDIAPAIQPAAAAKPKILIAGQTRAKAKATATFRVTLPPAAAISAFGVASPRRFAIDWDGDGDVDQIITGRAGKTVTIRRAFKSAGVYRPAVWAIGDRAAFESQGFVVRVV